MGAWEPDQFTKQQIAYAPTENPALPFERVSLTDAGAVQAFYSTMLGGAPGVAEATARLQEELDELQDALDFDGMGCCGDDDCPCGPVDDAHLLKEMVDVYYTILGLSLAKGWNFAGAFKAVHESNMGKMPNSDGQTTKIQKGPGYVEPDLNAYL